MHRSQKDLKVAPTDSSCGLIALAFNQKFPAVLSGDGIFASVIDEGRLLHCISKLSEQRGDGILELPAVHVKIGVRVSQPERGDPLYFPSA